MVLSKNVTIFGEFWFQVCSVFKSREFKWVHNDENKTMPPQKPMCASGWSFQVEDYLRLVGSVEISKTGLRPRIKRSSGEEISKSGRSVGTFFFLHFVAKITGKDLKIMIFSCSLRLQFFIQIFFKKIADFSLLFSFKRRISAIGKKRSVAAVEEVCLFLFFFILALK